MSNGTPQKRRFPLTRQVVVRLLQAWIITAAVTLLGAAWIYYTSFDKAAEQRSQDAFNHFSARVAQLEQDWETAAIRHKGRIEFMRLLEDRDRRWIRLNSYFTSQSGNPMFGQLLITDHRGDVLYHYGDASESLPRTMALGDSFGWFYDSGRETLYRVYRQPIWLGADGMGYVFFFKALDNALLFESAYPSTDLFLSWQGKVVASSSGETDNSGINPLYAGTLYRGGERYEQLLIRWGKNRRDSPVLILQQRVDRLFTQMEIAAAALAALSVLTLFTWFTVGFWLTRIAGRIEGLREASSRFALDSSVTPELRRLIAAARADGRDEIGAVADSVDTMMHAVVRRREELRRYQEVLRASESKLRSYFDLSVDGIAVVDGAGRFMEVNPAGCAMLGYSEAELMQISIADLKPSDEKSRVASQEHFRQLLATGRSAGELGHLRKDGTLVVLDVDGVAMGGERFLELMRDVTERRKLEETLQRQVDELARMNQELDEFTYMASHDLQEPLRKLVTFSDLLRRDAEGHLPPPAEADLNFISDAASRMRSLVRDLLALSHAGKSDMKREPLKLDEAADRALDALAIAIRETGAEISRDPLPRVRGDITMLTQLYQNLIGNALKYAGKAAPRIHLSAEVKNGEWVLGVRDNGIGIKPEHAERVFQPFKRLHGRGKYDGTGIGLAICRKVVERHGGRIWVESDVGGGAHFRFVLQPGQ